MLFPPLPGRVRRSGSSSLSHQGFSPVSDFVGSSYHGVPFLFLVLPPVELEVVDFSGGALVGVVSSGDSDVVSSSGVAFGVVFLSPWPRVRRSGSSSLSCQGFSPVRDFVGSSYQYVPLVFVVFLPSGVLERVVFPGVVSDIFVVASGSVIVGATEGPERSLIAFRMAQTLGYGPCDPQLPYKSSLSRSNATAHSVFTLP